VVNELVQDSTHSRRLDIRCDASDPTIVEVVVDTEDPDLVEEPVLELRFLRMRSCMGMPGVRVWHLTDSGGSASVIADFRLAVSVSGTCRGG